MVHYLNKEVEIYELGDAIYYMGIKTKREAEGSICQIRKKIVGFLEILGLQDAHSVTTPMQIKFYFSRLRWKVNYYQVILDTEQL